MYSSEKSSSLLVDPDVRGVRNAVGKAIGGLSPAAKKFVTEDFPPVLRVGLTAWEDELLANKHESRRGWDKFNTQRKELLIGLYDAGFRPIDILMLESLAFFRNPSNSKKYGEPDPADHYVAKAVELGVVVWDGKAGEWKSQVNIGSRFSSE